MELRFNKDLLPINKLLSDTYSADEFLVMSYSGRAFKFQRTSVACPLQYDVYDAEGRQVGYVRYRSEYFFVELFNEKVFELVGKELESWLDWQFVDCATTVIAAGYDKRRIPMELVR